VAAMLLLIPTATMPVAAQSVDLVPICIPVDEGETVILRFDGETLEFHGPGRFDASVPEEVAEVLVLAGVATPGPCPDEGGGGGDGGGAPLELTQETEQEAESGDIDQSFTVTGGGDNSNQCAGVQGVANTGNPQNVTDLLQAISEVDDFEFEEVGSDITVSPESSTTCDQQVNQAASASG
jgi:hypothetical protein